MNRFSTQNPHVCEKRNGSPTFPLDLQICISTEKNQCFLFHGVMQTSPEFLSKLEECRLY